MAENLLVRFWMDAYENPAKSKEAGRKVYDTVPWCEWRVPGESDTNGGPVHLLAREGPRRDPKVRFPEAWAAFERDNASEGLVGTPLKFVPWVERGDVENLAHAGVKTLEQLASITDGNLSNVPGGLGLRQKARDFIKVAEDAAPVERLSEELAKRDSEIAELKSQMAALMQARGAAPAEVKVRQKPGPKPRVRPEDVTPHQG